MIQIQIRSCKTAPTGRKKQWTRWRTVSPESKWPVWHRKAIIDAAQEQTKKEKTEDTEVQWRLVDNQHKKVDLDKRTPQEDFLDWATQQQIAPSVITTCATRCTTDDLLTKFHADTENYWEHPDRLALIEYASIFPWIKNARNVLLLGPKGPEHVYLQPWRPPVPMWQWVTFCEGLLLRFSGLRMDGTSLICPRAGSEEVCTHIAADHHAIMPVKEYESNWGSLLPKTVESIRITDRGIFTPNLPPPDTVTAPPEPEKQKPEPQDDYTDEEDDEYDGEDQPDECEEGTINICEDYPNCCGCEDFPYTTDEISQWVIACGLRLVGHYPYPLDRVADEYDLAATFLETRNGNPRQVPQISHTLKGIALHAAHSSLITNGPVWYTHPRKPALAASFVSFGGTDAACVGLRFDPLTTFHEPHWSAFVHIIERNGGRLDAEEPTGKKFYYLPAAASETALREIADAEIELHTPSIKLPPGRKAQIDQVTRWLLLAIGQDSMSPLTTPTPWAIRKKAAYVARIFLDTVADSLPDILPPGEDEIANPLEQWVLNKLKDGPVPTHRMKNAAVQAFQKHISYGSAAAVLADLATIKKRLNIPSVRHEKKWHWTPPK